MEESRITRGFYYDTQLENPSTSMSLYPNQILVTDDKGNPVWAKIDPGTVNDSPDDPSKSDCEDLPNGNYELDDKGNKTDKKPELYYYSRVPLVSAILTDDFQVSVANNWGDTGGDPLGNLWNSFKGLAPIYSKMSETMSKITEKTKEYSNSEYYNKEKSDIASAIGSGIGVMSKALGNASKLMNRGLSVQGSQFMYYGGSGIDFSNLALKFTIFPKYKDNKFISVYEQVKKILPYCIGPFIPVNLKKDFGLNTGGEVQKFVNEYAHWQLPPGGFESDTRYIDYVQKGTLKLVIGSYYAIQNLVVTSCNMNFSKSMVKNPTADLKDNFGTDRYRDDYLSPLYCEIGLGLKPATKYSEVTLRNVISGDFTKVKRSKYLTDMLKSLKHERKNYNYLDDSDIYV